jgi:hypothetical protein
MTIPFAPIFLLLIVQDKTVQLGDLAVLCEKGSHPSPRWASTNDKIFSFYHDGFL